MKKNLFIIYEDRAKNIKDNLFLNSLMKAVKVEEISELDYAKVGVFNESLAEIFKEMPKNDFPFMKVFDNKNFYEEELEKNFVINNTKTFTLEKEFKRKLGSATHFYLENITYGTEEEIIRARQLTTFRYGNMFGEKLLREVFENTDRIIKEFSWVFSDKYLVQKEFEIYDGDKTYRIDRLVIDTSKNKLWIIDYKTGGKDNEQLENYKNIIEKELGSQYTIETLFIFV